MGKRDAKRLNKLLKSAQQAEAALLKNNNVGLSKNLKRLIRLKQKISMLEE